jgi:hypothetical protein
MALFLVSGCCISTEVKTKTHENRVAVGAFIDNYMDKGKTTQAQDQAMLREAYKTLLLIDWGLNDDEEAKKILDAIEAKEAEKEKPKPDGGGG